MTETRAPYQVRNVSDETRARIARAAKVRGMTQGEFITRLIDLHEAMRAIADDRSIRASSLVNSDLTALGLQTVTG